MGADVDYPDTGQPALWSQAGKLELLRALHDCLGRRRSPTRKAEVGTRQVAGYGGAQRRAGELAFAGERALRSYVELPFGTSPIGRFSRAR